MIGVDARYQRARILALDQPDGEGKRRARPTSFRLLDDHVVGKAEPDQGGSAPLRLVGRGDHANALAETDNPLHGRSEQGLAARGEGQQVLRGRPAAQRPQASPTAACEHEDVQAHALLPRLRCELGGGGRDEEWLGAGILRPLLGEGGALPWEVEIAPAEVAVGGDLAVDGTAQFEGAHDPEGRKIDVLIDE